MGLRERAGAVNSMRLKEALPRILLPAAIFLWSVSLWQAELRIGPYGLVHSLPWLFGVALVLLNGSFLAALRWSGQHSFLLAAHLLALVASVDLIPIILEGTARFPYVYESYGYADYIVRNAHLNLSYAYHNWPALHLLNAALVQVSGISPVSLLLWAPLLLRGLGFLSLGLVFRKLCDSRQELWTALLLYVLFSFGPGYLLPTHLAGLLMLTVLSIAAARLLGNSLSPLKDLGYRLVLIILLGALISAHLLTSLATAIFLALTCAVAKVVERKDVGLNTSILTAVLLFFWLFYVAFNVTLPLLPRVLAESLNLDAVITETGQAAMGGSPQHTLVFLVRLAYVVSLSLMGLAAFLARVISERALRLELALPAVWAAGAASTVLITPYSGEIMSRAFALAFAGLVILAAKHVRGATFSVVVCIVLVAAILYPIKAWGNERVDYVVPSEIAAMDFFYGHRPSDYTLIAYPARAWYHKYMEEARSTGPSSWLFTVVGVPSERHLSFLRGDAEAVSYPRSQDLDSGQVYDTGSIQILVQPREVRQ